MKFALITKDNCNEPSYKVIDSKAYLLNGKPYNHPGGISNSIFRSPWCMTFANDAYFIHYSKGRMPDIHLDIILAVCERSPIGNFLSDLRLFYPKAKIIAYTKEEIPINSTNNKTLINFYNRCDEAAMFYQLEKNRKPFEQVINKPIHVIPITYDIQKIRNLFINVPKIPKTIFIGTNPNRGKQDCIKFGSYLGKKYGYEVIIPKNEIENIPWNSWLNYIRTSEIVLNLDNSPRFGQVPIECAILETQHLGGLTDGGEKLWGNCSSTNNWDILEGYFIEYIKGLNYIDLAYDRVCKYYSHSTLIEKLESLL